MPSAPVGEVRLVRDAAEAAALLHPIRLRLLEHLSEPDTASGLARRLGLSRQKTNYHLRQLERQGLVVLVEERRRGNCRERRVRAVAGGFVLSPEVLGRLGARPESVSDPNSTARLLAVASEIVRDVAALGPSDPGDAETPAPIEPTATLCTDFRLHSPEAWRDFVMEVATEVTRVVEKHRDRDDDRSEGAARPEPGAEGDDREDGVRVVLGILPAPPR
jgi:DNA-binding transcriptional ArsR family regulator